MLKNITAAILLSVAAICFGADSAATSSTSPISFAPPEVQPAVPAAPPAAPASIASGLQLHGWAWMTTGRVEKSDWEGGDGYDVQFNKEWLSDFDCGLKAIVPMPHDWRARLHWGVTTAYYVLDPRKKDAEALRRRWAFAILDAAMDKTFKFDNSQFYLEAGFFPVKTNPQAMNLGEYLFRSGTYPQTVYSGFEVSEKFKVVGAHASYKLMPNPDAWYKADLYFLCGYNDFPVHDWSPALVLTARPHPLIEVGAGIDYEHMIVVDNKRNKPFYDSTYANKRTPEHTLVYWLDTNEGHKGDTVIYQFRGIKTMGRITLDPKAIIPGASSIFGSEDLKLYGEAAILGLENYPGWYSKMSERIPIMFGFNFPAFKILDTFAIEGEYYHQPYWNSYENVWKYRAPMPYLGNKELIPTYENRGSNWFDKTDDDWRWSVYVSKKLFKMVRLSGQVASDHSVRTPYIYSPTGALKYTEICTNTTDWYWMTRIMFYF
jgi:hypothetical protein